MYVKRLSLQNFRNYRSEEIVFGSGTNILYGDNAQGKTNALEALYLFSIGKSFRTPQDRDMILFGEEATRVELEFADAQRNNTIEITIRRDRKKQIKVNGVGIHKLSELVGKLNVVLFCPEELGLVKEGPNVRRRFLDIAVSQLRPKYYYLLGRYNKVLEQRNKLIKKIRFQGEGGLADTMFVWNEKLADYGAEIIRYRLEFVEKLGGFAKKVHHEVSGEALTLEYRTKYADRAALLEKLGASLPRELEAGYTLYGPHRDDLNLFIEEKDAKNFASQGQQRSVVLSLKLAQADLLFEETDEYPVLLLDDIMSELDAGRRAYLVQKIYNKQVVITCTDIDRLLQDGQANEIHIQNGAVL